MRVKIFLLTAAIFIANQPTSFATDTTLPISATQYTADQRGNFGFVLRDSYLASSENSFLSAFSKSGNTYLCESLDQPFCANSTFTNWDAIVIAPPCSIDSSSLCINEFKVIDESGTAHTASLIRIIKTRSSFKGDLSKNLPTGSTTSLWKVDTGSGVATFAIHMKEQLQVENVKTDNFKPVNFELSIAEYIERSVPEAQTIGSSVMAYPDGKQGLINSGTPSKINCAWQEQGTCGVEQVLNPNLRLQLSFQIQNELQGWLHGRLTDAEVNSEPINEKLSMMTISGRPSFVPTVSAFVPYTETTPEMKAMYANNSHAAIGDTVGYVIPSVGNAALNYLSVFSNVLKDKATSKIGIWSVGSISPAAASVRNPCLINSKGFIGLVTSNAMVYEDAPPTLEDGTFNYKVGGLHYNPDGSVFSGYYGFTISSSVVRCLYEMTPAPILASVSITGAAGEEKVFTTTFVEENNWVRLSASGFSFSNPEIKVKFTQAQPPKVNPSPSPTTTASSKPSASPLKQIFCIKGKVIKKILAINPKCPSGFRKR